MDYDQFQFWQEVYLTSIRRGDPAIVARVIADHAAKDFSEVQDQEQEEGN